MRKISMKYAENLLHIRCLLLIFTVGLLGAILSAQTISQNTDESHATGEKRDDTIAKDAKDAEIMKQAEAKPPRFGGHVGIVIPIVTRGNGMTTTIAENFIIGFPFALIVRTDSPVAFDFEFVPIINTPSNQDFRFLIHPGVVYNYKKYGFGLRAAYEVGTGSYGFTPLVSRSFKLTKKTNYFIEADFPVRRERRPDRTRFTSVQFAVHSGISF
ncbi:MAG: hypothetical protein M3Q26_05510 [Acidobacteriota bacterium]|nr:hypothetical protein [Acidobacteriota bacterium]